MDKVLIITNSYPNDEDDWKGCFVQTFAREVAKLNRNVFVISLRSTKSRQEVVPPLLKNSYPTLVIDSIHSDKLFISPFLHPYEFDNELVSAYKKIKEIVNMKCFDRIFSVWSFPSGYLAYLLSQEFSISYSTWSLGSDIWKAEHNPFYRRILKKILKNSRYLFSDAPCLSRQVEKLIDKEVKEISAISELQKNKTEQPTFADILFIGRYEKNKGPDILANALRKLWEKGLWHGYTGYFYGEGNLQSTLEKTLKPIEDTYVCGPLTRNSLYSVLKNACLLVIPSRKESIPALLYDAIQSGIPLLVSAEGDTYNKALDYYNEEHVRIFDVHNSVSLVNNLFNNMYITRLRPEALEHDLMPFYRRILRLHSVAY